MDNTRIAVIGLGYVGLPLARLFATKYPVIGFDINEKRVNELQGGKDFTLEVEDDVLQAVLVQEIPESKGLFCAHTLADISGCNVYIITVPTPVSDHCPQCGAEKLTSVQDSLEQEQNNPYVCLSQNFAIYHIRINQ